MKRIEIRASSANEMQIFSVNLCDNAESKAYFMENWSIYFEKPCLIILNAVWAKILG